MVEVNDQEMGDGMQCSNHPYTKNPGGICAICLQEKLGKLVSSSFPLPRQPSSSSSSSPSFRSDSVGTSASVTGNLSAAGSLSLSLSVAEAANSTGNEGYYYNGSNGRVSHKLPFLLAKKKKKMLAASSSSSANRTADVVYKRSKSTTTPRTVYGQDFSPRKRGFWSFLHLYSSKDHRSSSSSITSGKKVENVHNVSARTTNNISNNQRENGLSKTDKNETRTDQLEPGSTSSSSSSFSKRVGGVRGNRNGIDVIVEEDGSPNVVVAETPGRGVNGGGNSSFERKVSRSRSVGCGSRSFSGDFFERISNGFGDCTLRRVESQREGANKAKVNSSSCNGGGAGIRDMMRCGGIFGGFMIMTSSSSSSSSSSWISSSSVDHHPHNHHSLVHGKNRSRGWAFASPMRAFTSTSTTTKVSSSSGKDGRRGRTITESSSKNTTSNLDAIPSLLAVRS